MRSLTLSQYFWRAWYGSWLYRRLDDMATLREGLQLYNNLSKVASHIPAMTRLCMSADPHILSEQVSHEIVRRREVLYATGARPDDPQIPDRSDIEKAWGIPDRFEVLEKRLLRQGYLQES